MIQTFYDILLHRLKEHIDKSSQPLLSNTVKSMEEYRLISGKKIGLEEADIIVRNLYRELVEEKPLPSMDRRNNDESEFY